MGVSQLVMRRVSRETLVERCRESRGDAAMAERVFATWHAARNAPKLFEGVEPMLRRLKERVKLGVLATQFHVEK